LVHLDYRDARPIYTQIADNFRNQIRAGVLAEGDKLPSVRELASELAINPTPSREPIGSWKPTAGLPPCRARAALSAAHHGRKIRKQMPCGRSWTQSPPS